MMTLLRAATVGSMVAGLAAVTVAVAAQLPPEPLILESALAKVSDPAST